MCVGGGLTCEQWMDWRDMGTRGPGYISFHREEWVECWEVGAEVRKEKDQSDNEGVLLGSWVDVAALC